MTAIKLSVRAEAAAKKELKKSEKKRERKAARQTMKAFLGEVTLSMKMASIAEDGAEIPEEA